MTQQPTKQECDAIVEQVLEDLACELERLGRMRRVLWGIGDERASAYISAGGMARLKMNAPPKSANDALCEGGKQSAELKQ